ncbi:hypothetical protein HK104_010191 [Borealophlyctis nickersoniae]|nr:hypothetical protein HK104_010191 [Borealophlyctis nickersoniae]
MEDEPAESSSEKTTVTETTQEGGIVWEFAQFGNRYITPLTELEEPFVTRTLCLLGSTPDIPDVKLTSKGLQSYFTKLVYDYEPIGEEDWAELSRSDTARLKVVRLEQAEEGNECCDGRHFAKVDQLLPEAVPKEDDNGSAAEWDMGTLLADSFEKQFHFHHSEGEGTEEGKMMLVRDLTGMSCKD